VVSPKRGSPVAEVRRSVGVTSIVIEPEHLAGLTPEQREDLRLWHGRVNLFDRIKTLRRYTLATVAAIGLGAAGFGFGVAEGIPPFVLAPVVPVYMSVKWSRRVKSLRKSGLKLRRVLLSLRSKSVIPRPTPTPTERQLAKLAPREILEGPHGPAIRRAAEDRAAILDIVATLPKADRALIPDVVPAVNALVERVAHLAQMFDRLNQSFDQRLVMDLDARISEAQTIANTPEGQHRLSLLQRQRATAESLVQRRTALARQIDNAGLALGNLRLDLIKLRSSGLQSALSDVTSATQEARVLSRDIDAALDAAAEVKNL
jgi:serine/threonine-protein kinase